MRRFHLFSALILVPAAALVLTVAGCSSKTEDKKPVAPVTPPKTDGAKAPDTKGATETITAKYDGVIKGIVKYDGQPPAEPEIKGMKEHSDKDVCLKGSENEKVEQTWLVGKNNGVANVIVYLKAPTGKNFDANSAKANYENPAVLDQPHCAFVPHIVALYPAGGQKLVLKNSAQVPHNTNMQGNRLKNPDLNVVLKPGETRPPMDLKYQTDPLKVKCDLHTWMNAQVVTLDTPLFAVTNEKGEFEIKNVPSDVEVTVMTWHEGTGNQEAKKDTFKAGDNALELKVSRK